MAAIPSALAASCPAVVVCVDDDPAILRCYGRIFRNEPFRLLTFDDPGKALAWIEQADVDLVLSDERMPGMTGTELLEEVGRRSPGTGRLLITACPAPGMGGAARVLSKPWDDQDLRGAIRHLLHASE